MKWNWGDCMKSGKDNVVYKEEQSLPRWVWYIFSLPGFFVIVISFLQLVLRIEVGTKPMSNADLIVTAIIFGVLLPIIILFLRLRIEVTESEIIVKLLPFYRRRISFEHIKRIKRVQIQPLREFGGRGIRWNGAKWGIILQGTKGVELELKEGIPVVISTRYSEKFAAIVEQLHEQADRDPFS